MKSSMVLILVWFNIVFSVVAEDFFYNIGDSQVAVNGSYTTWNRIRSSSQSGFFYENEDYDWGNYDIHANEWGSVSYLVGDWSPIPAGPNVDASGATVMNRAEVTSFSNGFNCSAVSELDIDLITNLIPEPEEGEVPLDGWDIEIIGYSES